MTMSILRFLEASKGEIVIDEVPIGDLSLEKLRSKITIILQESSLFEGTLKRNVDPLEQHTDEEIKEVLASCSLEQMVNEEGLDKMVKDLF
jgi:ATP-binding cassette subfamily C (CFTR/MRP) protein 2